MSQETDDQAARLEIYKLLVEMTDRVSQRRQSANSFYLSINTAIVTASAFLTGNLHEYGSLVISIAGVAICALWLRNITSYKTLNEAKFRVIQALEEHLPAQPYTDEWRILAPGQKGSRHTPFHAVESLVPWIFGLVHLVQAVASIPWPDLTNWSL